jgi:hypothetical protein
MSALGQKRTLVFEMKFSPPTLENPTSEMIQQKSLPHKACELAHHGPALAPAVPARTDP